ncbi:MAG TPA: hypothetical protein PLS81_02770 [Deltaproteobacteria bacterium]|nr:hypothetical protein [Deltaproteobacteria bacterium]HOM28365.1 hypothetical protein [Deltaproteobacteria bacterium]HPP80025.1 hypothetical protein [Deltaproteobacteria bacterium]
MIINRLLPALAAALFAVLATGCSTVNIDWDMANSINTIEAYEEFLAKHPDSVYTDEALRRVEPMRFKKAMEDGSPRALTAYLVRYPDGRHVAAVRARLKELRCADTGLKKKDYPSWLRVAPAKDELHKSSWYLDKSYFGINPASIGRGFRASCDDPQAPLDLAWDKDRLVYFGGKGVIVGPDGTAVLVGYDCR